MKSTISKTTRCRANLPASSNSLQSMKAVTDVSSDGLATTVLPQIRAGASLKVSK